MQSTCTACRTITSLTRQLCHSHYKYNHEKKTTDKNDENDLNLKIESTVNYD